MDFGESGGLQMFGSIWSGRGEERGGGRERGEKGVYIPNTTCYPYSLIDRDLIKPSYLTLSNYPL